jgi:hypothetical protein
MARFDGETWHLLGEVPSNEGAGGKRPYPPSRKSDKKGSDPCQG